ncbi:MAG: CDP-glycerol glycerophosphotransferase family protein [Simkaniaceae bacterium]
MRQHKGCALVYGQMIHHLDHLATLASILQIPLIVTEEEIEKAAKRHYPSLVTYFYDPLMAPKEIVKKYDFVFSSLPIDLFNEIFFVSMQMLQKKLLSIWVPHGQSDKGSFSPFYEALYKESIALVYGERMIDQFKSAKLLDKISHIIEVGNYRLDYYQQHKSFYDKLISNTLLKSLDPKKRTLLYAPTWQDREDSCSLFHLGPQLINNISANFNLIIKLHPNTLLSDLPAIESLKGLAEKKENIHFLASFSPIYPLLGLTDLYLGDMSSIGYDFLAFDRPLILINHHMREKQPLSEAALTLTPSDFDHIEDFFYSDQPQLQKNRQNLYKKTFSSKHLSLLKEEIFDLIDYLIEETLFI